MSGTLYVVATPIGNLEDITLRAVRVLRDVDLIACEDTRQTSKLLSHYQIQKPTTSYHEHNEIEKADFLLKELLAGKQVALVSDAGTPCISDPGYRIVRSALQNGVRVSPIPGPCSFVAALSASGRPTDAFTFLGFLPARKGARTTFLKSLKEENRTLIFFESPNRLSAALRDVNTILGPRMVTVARELTKLYEEIFSGTPQQASDYFHERKIKGEIVLIVEKDISGGYTPPSLEPGEIRKKVQKLVESLGISKNEALRQLSREFGISRRALYHQLLEQENKVDRKVGTDNSSN